MTGFQESSEFAFQTDEPINDEGIQLRAAATRPRGMTRSRFERSQLVDAGANRRFGDALAIHLLGLDLLRHWVGELVVLPERRLRPRQIDALLDIGLAVNVLRVE